MMTRKRVSTAAILSWGCCLLSLAAVPGCGPGSNGNGNGNGNSNGNGTRISAADCARLAAGAVSMNTGAASGLAASAVTPQCEQLAVYNEGGQTKEIAISIPGQDRPVIAVFGSDGTLTAVRSGDQTVTTSNNTALGFSRVESDGQSTLVVNREEGTNARRSASQNNDEPAFCGDLMEFSDLMEDGCESDPSLPYCSGAIRSAASAGRRLCESADLQEVDGIDGLAFDDTPEDVALGTLALFTTRPATAGGTTAILAAVIYGGTAPYHVSWSQISGNSVGLEQLGDSAIADIAVSAGTYGFQVEVSDDTGASVTDSIDVDLGTRGSDLIAIEFSPLGPTSGQEVSFSFRTGTGDDGPAQGPSECLWNFGDAGADSIFEGTTATHTYTQKGTYTVTLVCNTSGGLRNASTEVRVDGGDGSNDLVVTLDVDLAPMAIGERRLVTASTSGGVGAADVAILAGGPSSLVEGDATNAQSVAFSSTATLTALEPGVIPLGAVAFDAAGNTAETITGIAACGSEGGLFVQILGPTFMAENDALPVLLAAATCDGDGALTYNWSVVDGGVTLSNPRVASPLVTATSPGLAVLDVTVTDSTGNVQHDSIGIEIVPQIFTEFCVGGDGFCDDFCDNPDPDCDLCGASDGVCVFLCPLGEDPDCEITFCVAGDGICDSDCPDPDPDCNSDFCIPDDGFCDFPCSGGLDPDCAGFTSDDLCVELGYCCADDEFCDAGCPEPDASCDFCGSDGQCVFDCPTPDPDCPDPAEACGDGSCDFDLGENEFTCPDDCAGFCGDGTCDFDEDEFVCPIDCGFGGGFCGDGFCDVDEDEFTCPDDCAAGGGLCGDAVCDSNEDEFTCPDDCAAGGGFCGDGVCDSSEDPSFCPEDCLGGGFCGDGVCDSSEDPSSCPQDCF